MKFTQLSVVLRRADAERAQALLNLAEPLALSIDDAADSPLFEPTPGETPLWPELIVHALFPAQFDAAALGRLLTDALESVSRTELREIDEAHWRAGLEQDVFVQRIADNLCIVPAEFDAPAPAANAVRLHMGLAFGTGRHATTMLCLQWLARNPPAGLTVCDYGCGSGILGIAALRLGAQSAIAIDNDPQAVSSARANAELNAVGQRFRAGSLEDFPSIQADVVLANILAATLSDSVDLIASMLRPAGRIVLSGILDRQCADIERAFAPRFEGFETSVHDGWACIAGRLR